ncbi:hypothetical protein PGB90_001648 [Kerria lacca]
MNEHQFNFCKASLISLQAELTRKKDEIFNRTKSETIKKMKLEIKPHIHEQLTLKRKADVKTNVINENDNDADAVENYSRKALLAKSELYDKLRSNELVIDDSNQYLVNFNTQSDSECKNKKSDSDLEDSDSENEWVTFVDSLGRSRTCLRADLSYYKNLDNKLKPEKSMTEIISKENGSSKIISEDLFLWNKKREELRKMWEEEEKRLKDKNDIHYQDVLFNEARTHGVGYFNFSQDENERKQQQEALKILREETEKSQMFTINLKEKRKQQMKQRIAAAKKRKCQRMGLVLEEEIDETCAEGANKNANANQHNIQVEETKILEKNIEEFLQNAKRSTYIRPWDVGKDNVKKPVMTQEEWIKKQRAARLNEFAPPTSY